jgi:hypothetical protein
MNPFFEFASRANGLESWLPERKRERERERERERDRERERERDRERETGGGGEVSHPRLGAVCVVVSRKLLSPFRRRGFRGIC